LGSGNDFAATAGIPTDTQKAAQLIAGSQPKYVDYIQMDSGLRTMNAVGAGMDVDVLERAYSGKHHGKSKYAKALIKSIFAYKSRYFSVSYDGGERVRYNGLIACLGNGKQIGGGIKLFPDADICDGYMNLIIVDYLSLPKTISAFIKLGLGKINSVKDATCVKCKQAEIIPEDEEFTIQSDGELYKNVPMNARLISNTLKFYLP
jgi:diacylglycerol kinase (ATP)